MEDETGLSRDLLFFENIIRSKEESDGVPEQPNIKRIRKEDHPKLRISIGCGKIKSSTKDSDSVLEQSGKEDHIYGGRPDEHDKERTELKNLLTEVLDSQDKERTELKNLLTGVLDSNKARLQKLCDKYKPENEKMRKCFSHNLNSQPIDGDYTLEDPLKIESWYFLTKEEARLHLQLDEYLESCSFIKPGDSPTAVIENLTTNGDSKLEIFRSLPKDLIVSAVQRRINRLNQIAEHQRFVELGRYLIAQDYKKYGDSLDILSARLESENYEVDDNIRVEGLLAYLDIFQMLPDSAEVEQFGEIQRRFHDHCKERLRCIAEQWELNETDSYIYYSAYKELLKECEMKHPEELERMECCDSSYMDSEGWKQEMIEDITVDIENQLKMIKEEIRKKIMQCSCGSCAVLESLNEFKQWILIFDSHTAELEREMEMGDGEEIQEELEGVEELQKTGQEMDDSEGKYSKLSLELIEMGSEFEMLYKEIWRMWSFLTLEDNLQGNRLTEVENDFDVWKSEHDAAKKEAYQHLKFDEFLKSCAFIKYDSSSIEIFEDLKKQGKILIPEELALSSIESRIDTLKSWNHRYEYVEFLKGLVDHIPHITYCDKISEIYDRLRLENKLSSLSDYEIKTGLQDFHNLLLSMEPIYHPRIREADRDDLLFMIDWLCREDRHHKRKLWRQTGDPNRIYDEVIKEKIEKKRSSKKFKYAKEMVRLHERLDSSLASCTFVEFNSIHGKKLVEDKKLEFASLPEELVDQSIDFRIRTVTNMHEFERSAAFLKYLVWQRYSGPGGYDPQVLLKKVEDGLFADLRAEYREFADLSEHSIIEGILAYKDLCSYASERSLDPLRLVRTTCHMRNLKISGMWEGAKFYEHPIYEEASW